MAQHFVAVSANSYAAQEFGIDRDNIFEFWDFVGGRYSVWSAIGLPIALYIGFANFKQFLAGAHALDIHFFATSWQDNLPVIAALLTIWHVNCCDFASWLVSPYDSRLKQLPAYLQQLAMESNGKSVTKSGERLDYNTCPIIWGGSAI